MKVEIPSLAPILRSTTQGRVLAALVLDPERERSVSALTRLADSTLTTTGREVDRAETAGLVSTRKQGNTRLVRVNQHHPLYAHVAAIVSATFGVPEIVADMFAGLRGVERLLIIGSWAARWDSITGGPPNDIDLLLIGDPPRDEADEAAIAAEHRIGLPVQVVVRSAEAWDHRTDPFLAEVSSRPYVDITDRLRKGDRS